MAIDAGTKLGRYEIRSKIGEGGMGEVYVARDTQIGRDVAIKVLPPDLATDTDRLRRFEQEACAAGALNHPNIAHIYEVGEQDGINFIAMEFVDGQTLREAMRTSLSLPRILRHLQHVAEGLSKAHAAGIVHRDLKPENIMITRDGHAKILDFGLAKLVEQRALDRHSQELSSLPTALMQQRSAPGMVLGTIGYMSPEQAQGRVNEIDQRSDIFSFGCILYEAVTGRRAFSGTDSLDTLHKIVHAPTPQIGDVNPSAPPELQRIVRRCLAKDPDKRYQALKDVAIELEELRHELEGLTRDGSVTRSHSAEQTATANSDGNHPTSTAKTADGLFARHRTAIVVTASLTVVLLAALGIYLYQRGSAASNAAVDSIAVLPFINDKNDPNAEYLADGIPESIINSLSQLSQLRVMSRNSVFRYKGQQVDAQAVGHDLKVAAVLTGHVSEQAGNLWVSVELVNTRNGAQIWGQQYNRALAQVFQTQEEIAREVSDKLRLRLSGAEQQQISRRYTGNVKAFEYYTQGRSHLGLRTREELTTAIDYYQKAIAEDDNYALAYAGIAEVYANMGGRAYLPPSEARGKAQAAAEKALSLDPNLAEAHLAIAEISILIAPFDFARADQSLQRALDLSPNLASVHQYLGNSYVLRGRYDEALREFLKARELDPLSSILARLVVGPYYYRRDYARAMELMRQANELRPSYLTLWEVGVYIENRQFDYAWSELDKEKQRSDDPILLESAGQLYAAQGRRDDALKIIKQLETHFTQGATSSYVAAIYARLGDKEQAFAALNRGLDADAVFFFIKDDPVWDPLRADPRFAAALRRMNLPVS